MPDTETAVTPVPEVVDVTTPAPTPVAKKLSESERLKAAADELAKAEPAPKEGDEPAEAKEAPADPNAPREIKNAEWREYRKRSAKLDKAERAYEQKYQHVQQVEQAVQQWQAEKQLLKENPKAFWAKVAKEHGSDFTAEYSKFADAYISEGQPDAKLDSALKRIDELNAKLEGRDKSEAEAKKAQRTSNVEQEFVRVAIADEFKSTQFTFRKYGERNVVADGMKVAEHLMRTLGRAPSDPEIAAELDLQYQNHYKEIFDSHHALSPPQPGVAERVNGAEQSAKPVAPKAPKTLTNGGSAERAAPARKMTERERIEAAAKLLP